MAVPVPFTGNVQEVSNYNGFQWAFHCNRCGNVTSRQKLSKSVRARVACLSYR